MAITSEQAQRYRDDGFIFPIPIMSRDQALYYRQRFDDLEARVGKEKATIGILDAHMEERFVWDLAVDPRILDAVEAAIGPNVLLLGTHFICKYGGNASIAQFIAWHQDLTYWGLDPALAITAWYAVDDSGVENGCMQIIPGTHRAGIREHRKSERPGNMLRINQAVPIDDEERRSVDVVLRAGEISLHDGLAIHGSPPNTSDRRRCGLAIKYVPSYVAQSPDRSHIRSKAILVRGEDREQHFAPIAPPFPIPVRA